MSTFRMIPIGDLVRRPDVRSIDNDALEALAESIDALGLMNPLTVRPLPNGKFEIIAGSHRYAACDSLDHQEIPCQVVQLDDLHAEMAMIDENLRRSELSPSERARQVARRKAVYVELHPETRVGAHNQHSAPRQLGDEQFERFTADTATATGRSERAVQRDAERGEKVIDEVLDMIRGTKLDTGTYLDKLKKLPPNEQVHAARRDLAFDKRKPAQPAPRPQQQASPPLSSIDAAAYEHFIELADRIEALRVSDIIAAAGREKSKLGQRASGLADFMNDILEGLAQ